jgi:hypothetical protein
VPGGIVPASFLLLSSGVVMPGADYMLG